MLCRVDHIFSIITRLKPSENPKSSGLVTLNVSQSVVVKLSWNVLFFLCFTDSDDWARYRADLSSSLACRAKNWPTQEPFYLSDASSCSVEQMHALLHLLVVREVFKIYQILISGLPVFIFLSDLRKLSLNMDLHNNLVLDIRIIRSIYLVLFS